MRQPAEVAGVVAGVDGVAQLAELDATHEVVDGVLDRDDGVDLLRGGVRLQRDRGAGAARDVVEHDRYAGRLGDGPEVVEHAGLAGLVVVRRHEQQPVGADLLGLLGELERVGGRVGADTGDHAGPVAHGVLDRGQDLAVLGDGGRRRLPRRTGDHDAVVPVVDQVGRDARGAVEVDRPVVLERRRHRGQQRPNGAAACHQTSSAGSHDVLSRALGQSSSSMPTYARPWRSTVTSSSGPAASSGPHRTTSCIILERHTRDLALSLYGRKLGSSCRPLADADEDPSATPVRSTSARAWRAVPKVVFSRPATGRG